MADWRAGASFSNSFLNTIQALSAFENAQMQNDRLQQQMKREQEYENTLKEESTAGRGIDVPTAIQKGVQFKDFTDESGNTVTAAQQRQALQGALSNPNLTNEERMAALKGYAGTEYAMPTEKGGIDLASMKAYQNAGGETRMNALGREATQSDVYNRVRQRMSESGNIFGQEQALKMGKLTREDEKEQRIEMLHSNVARAEQLLEGKDVAPAIQHLSPMVASATGHNINYVTKPNGKQLIEVTDKKGKVLDSFSANMDELRKRVTPLVGDYIVKERSKFDSEFALKAREVESKAGYYEANKKYIEKKTTEGTGTGGTSGTSGKFTLLGGGYKFNNKTGDVLSPEGKVVTDPAKLNEIAKFGAKPPEMKALGEGYFQMGNETFMADPKNPGKLLKVELPGQDPYANALKGDKVDRSRPGAPAPAPAAPQQAIPVARPDLSKWTMKPAGKTLFGETDYVLEGPTGRMSLSDFIDRYGYNPTAEFIGRR